LEPELIDLGSLKLLPFHYDRPRHADAFDAVTDRVLAHRAVVFATPVYWYAMSGIMKTFLDRLTDLLSHRDPQRRGRQLAGRQVWLLAVGTDAELPTGFDVPFQSTAAYLGMGWQGACYCRTGTDFAEDNRQRLEQLAAIVQAVIAA
jgi:multimeric flavodoxin WrbA